MSPDYIRPCVNRIDKTACGTNTRRSHREFMTEHAGHGAKHGERDVSAESARMHVRPADQFPAYYKEWRIPADSAI